MKCGGSLPQLNSREGTIILSSKDTGGSILNSFLAIIVRGGGGDNNFIV